MSEVLLHRRHSGPSTDATCRASAGADLPPHARNARADAQTCARACERESLEIGWHASGAFRGSGRSAACTLRSTHVVGLAITAWKWLNWLSACLTTFWVASRVENISTASSTTLSSGRQVAPEHSGRGILIKSMELRGACE